ncbi:MAG: formate C-acetyltransferase [Rhodospirillaceae bacterium]|jgi:pyruvate formate-lyase/glycerol dehydratase family glycyl radical enzyme|nr:formate C-acetyltransferase [Rhodospirillaceae bacterium]
MMNYLAKKDVATKGFPRIERLMAHVNPLRHPICIEKNKLIIDSFRQSAGEPEILRRAKATAHYLDNKTIFIDDDELIVGNPASKRNGLEAGAMGPTWSAEEFDHLRRDGYEISPADEAKLREQDDYWTGQGRTLYERLGSYFDDDRLWPFIQSGIMLPPWKKKNEGRGHGLAEGSWGLGLGLSLIVVDFEKVLTDGLESIITAAELELQNLHFESTADVDKADFLKSVIIVHQSLIRIANRFADLAEDMAAQEGDLERRLELEQIAETCRRVPAQPARNFPEAMQSFWFIWLTIASGTAAGGRFDQFMYPFYQSDREAGEFSDDQAVELLACLRAKVMQVNTVWGGKEQRKKWAGRAKWNNWVIGGVDCDGNDATNALTYLMLDAVKVCPTPHHTVTLRVHDNTPDGLMQKALEVVRLGVGMPAFVSDDSYIAYLTGNGVALEEARDYALGGCLDANLPGKSRTNATGMFIVPLVFEITLNNGVEPRTGQQLGPVTGNFEDFETFEDLVAAFKTQLAHFMGLAAEEHNLLLKVQRETFPDAVHSSLMADAITIGKDALDRTMPFENGSALNPVGMINVADSLAAIKELIFNDGPVSKAELRAALLADWSGYEDLRQQCAAVPKFGNGDPVVDALAGELYEFWASTAETFTTIYGGTVKASGISITSYGPGGALTGATPDGRRAGEALADGSVSAAQGRDTNGPTALIRSAMTIDQTAYQSTLFNVKFHPSALQSRTDRGKVADLIKVYFKNGGKHLQFNVVDRETLLDAQQHPENHRDLIVRVAGYSAYFTQLTPVIQNEIISRNELD